METFRYRYRFEVLTFDWYWYRYQHRFAVYLQPRGKLADPEIYLEVVLLQDPGLEAHRKKLKIN